MNDPDEYNPFGKGGAGAPIRDNHGNVITSRKAVGSKNQEDGDK